MTTRSLDTWTLNKIPLGVETRSRLKLETVNQYIVEPFLKVTEKHQKIKGLYFMFPFHITFESQSCYNFASMILKQSMCQWECVQLLVMLIEL